MNDFEGFNLILPVGISFYTFTALGYCIDVFRNEIVAEKNFLKHSLVISYFPHVAQGPIEKYDSLRRQLFSNHEFDMTYICKGLKRIAAGFIKKMFIADSIGSVIAPPENVYGLSVLFLLILFSLQLYFDFSGYMDIAIGCSNMLGIKISENFKSPYFSKSISEFWQRWHITLGEWFKSYVFYPIMKSKICLFVMEKCWNRKYLRKTIPTALSLFVFWIFVGFWHGASFGYIAYGLFHGFFMIASLFLAPIYKKFYEKFPKLKNSYLWNSFQIIRTYLLVCVGYSFFWNGWFSFGIQTIRNLFLIYNKNTFILDTMLLKNIAFPLVLSFVLLVYEEIKCIKPELIKNFTSKIPGIIKFCLYSFIIMCIVFFALREGNYASFIYYKF